MVGNSPNKLRTSESDSALKDTHGRQINYLRLSITQKCPMSCIYCRPANYKQCTSSHNLSSEQMIQFVSHMASQYGITKVRITGGEPTAHFELINLISGISSIPQVKDLAMTTGGLTLANSAHAYAQAGLNRINISLDSLDQTMFKSMTGVNGLERVLDGINAAKNANISPIKLNTVVLRGKNDHELGNLVHFAAEQAISIRFIELMPMGPLAASWSKYYMPVSQIQHRLAPSIRQWTEYPQGADSAKMYKATLHTGKQVKIGFITPMSCNFCDNCNRIRITSDGEVYPCLMDQSAGSILPAMKPVFNPDHLDTILHDCLTLKAPQHPTIGLNVMTNIGG
ncbi:GTP 3',8-cyclase MoaA [Planctomycetota bacterium]|nr:GTP 3',8-cyclase MoaA [Planctomycetota bacterium]